MSKTLLVITGPQGSGNHLFSKIFALHPSVKGWKELLDTYWIGHDNEPYAELWQFPELISKQIWADGYYVTSISCPYMYDGKKELPKYKKVLHEFTQVGFTVIVTIIGRDQTILTTQQSRVRGKASTDLFLTEIPELMNHSPTFISSELLYLYKEKYLESLSSHLGFPIAYSDTDNIRKILCVDPNKKYISPIGRQLLDDEVSYASIKKQPITRTDK